MMIQAPNRLTSSNPICCIILILLTILYIDNLVYNQEVQPYERILLDLRRGYPKVDIIRRGDLNGGNFL